LTSAPPGGMYTVTLGTGEYRQYVDFGVAQDFFPPTVEIPAVTPDPRGTPLDAVTIRFSEQVMGLDLADLTLTRDGQPVAMTDPSMLNTGNGQVWVLTNLAALTSAAGTYCVSLTSANAGITDMAGNPLATDVSRTWTVAYGQIQGTVWNDQDADGVFDSGEPGLTGLTVFLDSDLDGQPDSGEPTVLTGDNGTYSFAGLSPGTYRVAQVLASGWRATAPAAGAYSISLAVGQTQSAVDFGTTNRPAFTLDVDGNGTVEPLYDGLLLLRYGFGFRGQALTKGVLGVGATRTQPTDIVTLLDGVKDTILDVDDNKTMEPLFDGLLTLRYLFGFRGASLTKGVVGVGANRTDPQAITAYLTALTPPSSKSAASAKAAAAPYDAALTDHDWLDRGPAFHRVLASRRRP
jgi:hypothetical protein